MRQDRDPFFILTPGVANVRGMVTFPLNFIFITLFKIIPSRKTFPASVILMCIFIRNIRLNGAEKY